ncbi:MAG: DUF1177 domain-containing protein [Vicinamibacterales bacterium]
MSLRVTLDVLEMVDRPAIDLDQLRRRFTIEGGVAPELKGVVTDRGSTTFVRVVVPGTRGRTAGGNAPTLGIIGYLGGVGARPAQIGLVSDGDGAVAALAAGLKIVEMWRLGDRLEGDVIVTTHLCPDSPVVPHEPVPFMASPVGPEIMAEHLVDARMDAILAIDTTRGNRIVNHRGFAISPTVKEGYILRVSEDLLTLQQHVTGQLPVVFAITTQDITPYGNGVFHINSILQPAASTSAPVVGVALTAEIAVPGSATGASSEHDIAQAARFAVEVAKSFGRGRAAFYDPTEFARLVELYGPMTHLQRRGAATGADAWGVDPSKARP